MIFYRNWSKKTIKTVHNYPILDKLVNSRQAQEKMNGG